MKVVFVVGPTCTGKSNFAVQAAIKTSGEILNADSLQFYQSLDIGTAKPTPQEREVVPHHLYDFIPVGEVLTAGDYRRLALLKLDEMNSRGVKVAYIVGGSGFYLQALEKGMFDFGKVDPSIHNEVRLQAETDLHSLFLELRSKDPVYADKIGMADKYRIARAVELLRMFGKSPTELRSEFVPVPFPYEIIKVGFSMTRESLLHKVSERTRRMLKTGLILEVKNVLQKTSSKWPPLSSIGYKEVLLFLEGQFPEESLEPEIVQNTMRLAKRQMTWFKRDPEIDWYDSMQGFDRPLVELWVRLRL